MHEPVLREETLRALAVRDGGRYIDATVGDGGHAAALLIASAPTGQVLGIDRDVDALKMAADRLAAWSGRWRLAQANFADLDTAVAESGFDDVDGVIFDFGVRSDQLDRAERGFSFMRSGPLDMRMDQRQERTAADIVNEAPEGELADLLWRFGEEKSARRIARAIAARRMVQRFETTGDLAAVIEAAVGGRKSRIHPATQSFMALRMVVNDELAAIQTGLEKALTLVRPGGRIAAMTYHSGEDRLVKHLLAAHVGRWESQQAGGEKWIGDEPRYQWVSKKAIRPGEVEMMENPRARSAKLRVVERISE